MSKKIAVLRGINVAGKRKILMADLKALCEDLGWKNVVSYIQSGNLIFNSDVSNSELELQLEYAIANTYGFDVPVIVRNSNELEDIVKKNPFFKEDSLRQAQTDKDKINRIYLAFLKEKPTQENLEKTLAFNFEPDEFQIKEKEVFLCYSERYSKSKLTNNFLEQKLNVIATTRNWKTVLKLQELCK